MSCQELGRYICPLFQGDEIVRSNDREIGSISDFWRWSCSDLLSNTNRGIFAEFIIAKALGIETQIRNEWDNVDLRFPGGKTVEVKSSAYLQTWKQKSLAKISFGIARTTGWDAETNEKDERVMRRADIYVFVVLHHKEMASVNPLDMTQWTFYVVPTERLEEVVGSQKTITLGSLKRRLKPARATFEELKEAVTRC